MTAYERLRDALESHGSTVKDNGHGKFQAQCPAHDDGNPSLRVTAINGSVLLYCHAGCQTEDVLAAIEWTKTDLYDSPRGVEYVYPGGRRVRRTPDKSFPQSGNKADCSLYSSDRIGDAEHVLVVEGEKDVDAARAIGVAAVCSAMGAGKAHLADWEALRGKHVTVVPDDDEPGRKHAAQVVDKVRAAGAATVRVARVAVGKDLADHIAAGKTVEDLVAVDTGESVPRLWNALDLAPASRPRWLAIGRLPRAAITLLVGDEGIGKSLLWVWLVAFITTGKPFPAFGIPAREPGHVVIVVTEDDWASTVRPRLEVAGADLAMVRVICTDTDGSGSPVFPRDIHLVAAADPAPVCVVVDAWLDTVPGSLSVKDPQQARLALHPWKEIATTTDAAVLLLTHTNRVSSANARDRYGATGELRKVARMTLFAQADEAGQLVIGPEKMNTAKPLPASMFTIKSVRHFDPSDDHDGTVPQLVYAGESEMTAREHLAENMAPVGEPGAEAISWLATFLSTGPRWATDVFKAAEIAGLTEKKIRTAKPKLAVKASRANGNGPWFWHLPQHSGLPSVSEVPPDDPLRASGHLGIWESSGESHIPTTSCEDSLMTNGVTQGHLVYDETGAASPYGDLCSCKRFPARWDTGLCEWCSAKAAKAAGGAS